MPTVAIDNIYVTITVVCIAAEEFGISLQQYLSLFIFQLHRIVFNTGKSL